MLTGADRGAFLAQHVELRDDGFLIRKNGHFASKPIRGERFLVAGRQFETEAVRRYLEIGEWRPLPKRRTGKGACSAADRKRADERLLALMADEPGFGVRALARALGLTHPCVSRRITRLKQIGMVSRDDDRWQVERPTVARCASWVPALKVRERGEDRNVMRFG
jgi:hypothetical protein